MNQTEITAMFIILAIVDTAQREHRNKNWTMQKMKDMVKTLREDKNDIVADQLQKNIEILEKGEKLK